jgi:hypothetical protein
MNTNIIRTQKISLWIAHIKWSWGFKTSRSWMWSLWDINKYYFIDNYDRTITLYKIDFTLSISFRNWNCLKLPKTDYSVHDHIRLYLYKSDTKKRLLTLTYCSCTPRGTLTPGWELVVQTLQSIQHYDNNLKRWI